MHWQMLVTKIVMSLKMMAMGIEPRTSRLLSERSTFELISHVN